MKKLEKLTQDQINHLAHQRDKWLKIGLSTEPLDFENAKKWAIEAYKVAGLEEPKYFYRFQSPLSAAIAATYIKELANLKVFPNQVGAQVWAKVWAQVWAQVGDQVRAQVRDQVGAQVWAQVGAQVWAQVGAQVGAQVRAQVWAQVGAQVWDQVGDQVWAQVGAQVWAQVWDQVGDQVRAQVRDQVGAQVRDQVGAQVWDQVGAQVGDQVYGNHDANWLGFYETFSDFGIDTSKLNPLINLAKYCGWWAPYQNCVIFQDRPKTIKFDDQKRLHCENGPSIEYLDGFKVYSWHGTRIPEEWILQKPSAKDALAVENVEQRRAACEIVGWDSILNELNARLIDSNDDKQIGELFEVDIPEIGTEKFLRVLCGTGRTFAIPVPRNMKTAHQANAWTWGLTESEYHPEVRT